MPNLSAVKILPFMALMAVCHVSVWVKQQQAGRSAEHHDPLRPGGKADWISGKSPARIQEGPRMCHWGWWAIAVTFRGLLGFILPSAGFRRLPSPPRWSRLQATFRNLHRPFTGSDFHRHLTKAGQIPTLVVWLPLFMMPCNAVRGAARIKPE
nr:unnamed protein product [Digitaria exilis]